MPNVTMAHAFRDNLIQLGVQELNAEPITSFGSSNMDNVSHKINSFIVGLKKSLGIIIKSG